MAKKSRKQKRKSRPQSTDGNNISYPAFDAKEWHPLDNEIDKNRDKKYMRTIKPRSEGQKTLMEAIKEYNLTFAVGPAGTGKTYLAIAAAVEALEAGTVERIILSRPAMEAGESLGYLPGNAGAPPCT